MKRMTLGAIGLVTALVLIPTVIAVAQSGPADAPAGAGCPYHQEMVAEDMPCSTDGQGMMGQGQMGMMDQDRTNMMGQGQMGMMDQDRMDMMGQGQMGMMDQDRMDMMDQDRTDMMDQDRMGMMGQGQMGMMGQMPEDCPMRDARQG